MPLHLCLGHLEQYYKNDIDRNSARLAWLLEKHMVIKVNDMLEKCDWCELGMPKFI